MNKPNVVIVLAAALAASLLAACPSSEKAKAPKAKEAVMSTTYNLVSIEGQPVPCSPMHGGHRVPEVAGGTMTINSDGTFTHEMKFTDPRVKPASPNNTPGTYTRQGDALILKWPRAGYTKVTIEGDTLTMNNEGMIFVYRKQP
jgi:hypothetical protein